MVVEFMMKKSYLLILVSVVVAIAGCGTGGGFDPSSNYNLEVRENLPPSVMASIHDSRALADEFHIGTPREDVFETLGEPNAIFYGDVTYPIDTLDADAYHLYSSVGLSFRIFGPEVAEITLLNDDWIASNGLVVGMTREQMLAILGDDYRFFPAEIKDFYDYQQYGISVEVYHSTDSVGEINIQEENAQ